MSGPIYGISVVAALVLVASGSVPGVGNFAACNAEALDAVASRHGSPGGITPNTRDRERAADARRGDTARTEDPQLTGIDGEGAKNPAYQAAYRTCMRRSGF
jgi:hypothetical protein